MVEILPLRERPHAIATLAKWHFAQWGSMNPANAIERRLAAFQEHLQPGRVPQTFIALEGDRLLGSASLVSTDLPQRLDLYPWLASVYVDPAERNRGIGSRLVNRVVEEARSLGFPRLFLFTPDRAKFYAGLGWQKIEDSDWNGLPVTVMEYVLRPEGNAPTTP
jgi:GNAT superfamily N-acetyltransferase